MTNPPCVPGPIFSTEPQQRLYLFASYSSSNKNKHKVKWTSSISCCSVYVCVSQKSEIGRGSERAIEQPTHPTPAQRWPIKTPLCPTSDVCVCVHLAHAARLVANVCATLRKFEMDTWKAPEDDECSSTLGAPRNKAPLKQLQVDQNNTERNVLQLTRI